MIRLVFLLREDEYEELKRVCRELRFSTLDECVQWAIRRLLDRCLSGFKSSAISSDVSNHPPAPADE